jgi:hypothetical protein
VLFFFFIVFIGVTIDKFDIQKTLIGLLIFLFFAFMFFYLPDRIEFDDDSMYIMNKEREVSLKDIYSIAIIGAPFSRTGGLNLYKILYSYQGKQYTARFYPRLFFKSLNEFKVAVKNKNPSARVDLY